MPDLISVLRQLQAIDGELYRLRRQQQAKPRELELAQAKVAQQETQVKAADEQLKALQLQQKQKESDLQSRETNVKKLQGQLFQLKTNREYSTMQHEIDALKADNSLLEETILTSFDAVETAAKVRQQEQQRLADVKQELARDTARIELEVSALQEQITALEAKRQGAAPGLPKPILSTYDRILARSEGMAMAPLIGESCGGCHWRQPPQIISRVYLRTELVTCDHCSRILFADEDQPLPPSQS